MKKPVLIAAIAGCLLTAPALVTAPQAFAQSSVTVGPNGVTVREHDRDHWRRHRHRDHCRIVITRDHHHGRTIETRRRVCD